MVFSSSPYFSGAGHSFSYAQPVPYREIGLSAAEADRFLGHLYTAFNCKARYSPVLRSAPVPTTQDNGHRRSLVWTFGTNAACRDFSRAYQDARLGVHRWDRFFSAYDAQLGRPRRWAEHVDRVFATGANFSCPREVPFLKVDAGRVKTLSATSEVMRLLQAMSDEIASTLTRPLSPREQAFAARQIYAAHHGAEQFHAHF